MSSVCPCGAQAVRPEKYYLRCHSCGRSFLVVPPTSYADALAAIANALADNVESLSDEQILADAEACGVDVEVEADRVKAVLLQPVQLSLFGD